MWELQYGYGNKGAGSSLGVIHKELDCPKSLDAVEKARSLAIQELENVKERLAEYSKAIPGKRYFKDPSLAWVEPLS
jgi:hypothetical protein